MSVKKQILQHSFMSILLIGLLIIATFIDQRLADYSYIGEGISVVGAVLGKAPAWILFIIAATIMYKSAMLRERRDKTRMPLVLFYLFLIASGAFALGFSIVESIMSGVFMYLMIIIIGACSIMLAIMSSKKINPDMTSKLKKWAILTILVVGVIFVITIGLKLVWGRARYIEIITGDSVFTPWYKPNGFTGGTSMPSGHTAQAGAMFLLPLMFLALPKMKAYATTATALALLYMIFIATTRVMGGHHFLSDVTISAIIAYSITTIAAYIFYGRNLSNTTIAEGNFLNRL